MGSNHTHLGAGSIDEYAYSSHLKGVHGGLKLCYALAVVLISVGSSGWLVPVVATLACLTITVAFGGVRLKDYLALLTVPLVFLLMGALAIAATFSFEGGFSVEFRREDVLRALLVSVKALGAVSATYTLSLSTPIDEVVTLLGRMRLPELLCELMRLTYRYVYILLDAQARMQHAAAARLGYDGFARSIRTFGKVCANLLVVSLRRATYYYYAIESRSCGGRLRFLVGSKPLKAAHAVPLGACVALLLCLEVASRYVLR